MARLIGVVALIALCAPVRAEPAALAELVRAAGGAPARRLVAARPEPSAAIELTLFSGERRPLPAGPRKYLVRVIDERRRELVSRYFASPRLLIKDLPIQDGPNDDYTVLAWAPGLRQAGVFPVRLRAGETRRLELMLLPEEPRLDFSASEWEELPARAPLLSRLLRSDLPEAQARAHYEVLRSANPRAFATLLNVAEASTQLEVDGRPALSYFAAVAWNEMFRDRFWAYAEASMVAKIRADRKRFKPASTKFHEGATVSFKQVEYGEGNVQFTFYENDRVNMAGVQRVRVEVDMDLYRDPVAHFVFEVAPSLGRTGHTDPFDIYRLRWMAGRLERGVDFAPLYTVTE